MAEILAIKVKANNETYVVIYLINKNRTVIIIISMQPISKQNLFYFQAKVITSKIFEIQI